MSWVVAGGIVSLLLLITVMMLVPPPQDKVVFLDIGQGDSILLQNGTQQVLIDGGPGATVLERLGEELPWFDRTIDVVILTHPQQDHLEGLVHVLDRYRVGLVILPKAAYPSQLQAAWLQKLIDKKIPYRFSWAGEELRLADADVHILAPFPDAEDQALIAKNVNEASTTTRIDFDGMSFLLSGDAEKAAEHLLVQRTSPALLDIDVLKAGHHGSKTSTTPELLAAASPHIVAISVGAHNRYGHPTQEVLDRLKDLLVYRTDQLGSIRLIHEADRWLLSCGHGSCKTG